MINAGPIETVGDLITVLRHFNRETPVRFDSGAASGSAPPSATTGGGTRRCASRPAQEANTTSD